MGIFSGVPADLSARVGQFILPPVLWGIFFEFFTDFFWDKGAWLSPEVEKFSCGSSEKNSRMRSEQQSYSEKEILLACRLFWLSR